MSESSMCGFAGCARVFEQTRHWQRFCSTKCRMDHANGRRKAGLKLLGEALVAPLELESGVAATAAST